MSVLSPMFSERVSPRITVSLPIRESSSTISKRLEKEPMMEFLTMEKSMVVFSPIVAFGPIIEFLMVQPLPILTG